MKMLTFDKAVPFEALDASSVINMWVEGDGTTHRIKCQLTNSKATVLTFKTQADLQDAWKAIQDAQGTQTTKTGVSVNSVVNDLKSYVSENRNLVWTVVFVVLLDHFVFGGAFRERLKSLVEGLLNKAEGKTIDVSAIRKE